METRLFYYPFVDVVYYLWYYLIVVGVDNMGEEIQIFTKSVYDYLVLNYTHYQEYGTYFKLAGVITSKQIALADGIGYDSVHSSLIDYVMSKANLNDDVIFNNCVGLYAYLSCGFSIDIPDKINYQQYKIILDIIEQIRRFEKEYHVRIKFNYDIDEILEDAKNKLDDVVYINTSENIVGIPIDEQILIDSVKREIDIKNCSNVLDLLRISRAISKYYSDDYFQSVILKIVPNAKQISDIYLKLADLDRHFDESFLDVENVSYENIENYLQVLLLKIESLSNNQSILQK